jgi:hypothetical protein
VDLLSDPTQRLTREVGRLVDRVASWTSSAWAAPTALGPRAPLVHGLVQEIADLAADAEGQPRRRVPRLDNDVALADQLRVVAADLAAASPAAAVLGEAADRVEEIRRSLTRLR